MSGLNMTLVLLHRAEGRARRTGGCIGLRGTAGDVRNNLELRGLTKAGAHLTTVLLLITQLPYNDVFRAEAEDFVSISLSLPDKHWPVAWEEQTNSSEEDIHAML